MALRMIALDMDGTLLTHAMTLSQKDIDAVAEASAAGIAVVLASGRKLESMIKFYRALGLDTPMITCNGAVVTRPGEPPIDAFRVPEALAAEVIVWARGEGLYIEAFAGDHYLYDNPGAQHDYYARMSGMEGERVDDLSNLGCDPEKLLVVASPERLAEVQPAITARMKRRLNVFTSSPVYLEFTHPQATKGQALRRLTAYLGVAPDELMAVGDAQNDIDMITFAGIGVAMGNATDEVKAAARCVTHAVEKSGVAHAIRTWALPQ